MKIAIALALAMIAGPVLAQSQPFNPSGPLTQGYAVLVDGSTGLPYVASGGGGGGGGASANAAVAFRQTCTASAVQMASNTFANGAVISVISGAGVAYIGPSGVTTSTGFPISTNGTVPLSAISYGVANSNQLYLICSDTSTVVAVTGN